MLNIKLSEVIKLFDYKRKPLSKMQRLKMKGNIPYYGAAGIIDYVNESIFEGEYILLAEDGTVKTDKNNPVLNLTSPNEKFWVSNHVHIFKPKNIEIKYLYYVLSNINISQYITGAVQPKINQENLLNIDLKIHDNYDERCSIVNTISSALISLLLFLLTVYFLQINLIILEITF